MIARITEFEQERLVLPALAVAIKGRLFLHTKLIETNRQYQAKTVAKDCFDKTGVILIPC
jgi:hypothetical protein